MTGGVSGSQKFAINITNDNFRVNTVIVKTIIGTASSWEHPFEGIIILFSDMGTVYDCIKALDNLPPFLGIYIYKFQCLYLHTGIYICVPSDLSLLYKYYIYNVYCINYCFIS